MIGVYDAVRAAAPLRGEWVVVKTGGELLEREAWVEALAADVAVLARLGVRVAVVHGGGPQLDRLADALGLETRRVAGRRVTDPALIEAAIMEWRGRLSARWVRALQARGERAIGLAGFDGELVRAVRRAPAVLTDDEGRRVTVDFGEVGDVVAVDAALLRALAAHAVPVVSPLAAGPEGTVLNVNADTVAAELAGALGARALVLATRTPGVLADPDDPGSALARLSLGEVAARVASGAIHGGMRPKLEAIRGALEAGVGSAHILDGREPGALLDELLTHEGRGTLVVP